MDDSHRSPTAALTVVPLRFPPAGAFDFVVADLVRRHLDLASSLAHHTYGGPGVVLRDGKPLPWLFEHARRTHVVVVAAGPIDDQRLTVRAEVHDPSGSCDGETLTLAIDDAHAGTLAVARAVLERVGVEVALPDEQRMSAAAIPPGLALRALADHALALWGGGHDAPALLRSAADHGYGRAWLQLAAWPDVEVPLRTLAFDPAGLEPHLRHAVACDPHDLAAHVALAALLRATERASESVEALVAPLSWSPRSANLHAAHAAALADVGRIDEAVAAAAIAVDVAPADPALVCRLAEVLHASGRSSEAESAAWDVARRRPDDLGALVVQGLALLRSDRHSEALAQLAGCFDRVSGAPWHELRPYKRPHLDHHHSTRAWLAAWLAVAAAGAGDHAAAEGHVRAALGLGGDVDALAARHGGMESLVARCVDDARAWAARRRLVTA